MTRVRLTWILLGLPIVLLLGVAMFAPRPAPVLGRVALAITVLGGSYSLAYALIGLATRRVRATIAAGALALAAGSYLLGASYLPQPVPGAAMFSTLGAALLIVGAMVLARG